MILPDILPRMEEPDRRVRVGIKPDKVRALVQIAVHAGQREIVFRGRATMLPSSDVLNVERRVRFIINAETTVFAAVSRPLTNHLPQLRVHAQAALMFAMKAPALIRRIDISFDE